MATPADVSQQLQQNLRRVEERIQKACQQAHRRREEITLVGITKYVDVATTRQLFDLGLSHMGESRPQVMWEKAAALPQVQWHLVGHLQRNKVARTLEAKPIIHSVDSERLLKALEAEARQHQQTLQVFLELHLTEETSKSGFNPDDWPRLPELVNPQQHVHVVGLMGMAPLEGSLADARKAFAKLRDYRDLHQGLFAAPHQLKYLSMGMTGDFEEAIQEGATHIRVGSALFEGLEGRPSLATA